MKKLQLHYQKEFQGIFEKGALNFVFVFQVNCPGCFFYGIPIVNKLYKEFKDHMSFLGVSTTFEDYNYNTVDNTTMLLHTGQMVGETKKAFIQQGIDCYPYPLLFPVAMDQLATENFDYDVIAQQIGTQSKGYDVLSITEQEHFLLRIKHYLKNQEKLSLTFTLNQLRGTPSLIVFDQNNNILFHHFGHIEYETLSKTIHTLINKKFNI